MSNAQKSLIWKEYRETYPVGIMVFALGVITLFALPFIGPDFSGRSMALTILSSMLGVYVLVVSAIAFVREVDEGRYALLRRFPITSGMIARAKVGWILVSSLGLSAAFGLIWLICLAFGYDALTNETGGRFGLAILTSAEFFAWGLFWSVRTKRQLTALFMTPASAVFAPIPFLMLILPILKNLEMVNTVYTSWDIYTGPAGIVVRLLILAVLIIPVVRGLGSWFEIQARLDEREANRSTRVKPHAVSSQRRVVGSFRAFIMQGFRQQSHLLMVCGGIFYTALAVLIWRLDAVEKIKTVDPTEFGIYLALALAFITSVILTGGIFTNDFCAKENAPILRFAPKPGLFWFSRVIGVLGVWGIAATGAAIYYGIALVRSHSDFSYLWQLAAYDYYTAEAAYLTYTALLLFTAIPALGLWTSAFFRSRMISMFTQFALLIVFYYWLTVAFGTEALYGARAFSAHPLWSVFPLLIPFVLGSYFLVRAKLAGGISTKTRCRQIALVVVPPILLLLVVVPLVRIFSISILPLDSSPEEWVNCSFANRLLGEQEYLTEWWHSREYEYNHDTLPEAARFTNEAIDLSRSMMNSRYRFDDTPESAISLWGRYTGSDYQVLLASTTELESQIYSFAHNRAGAWSAEELRSMLALVQAMPRTRPNPTVSTSRLYHVLAAHNFTAKPGTPSAYCYSGYEYHVSHFWWENLRYRRQLWNAAHISDTLESENISVIEDGARRTCLRCSGPVPERSAEFFDQLDALKRKNLFPNNRSRGVSCGWTLRIDDASNPFITDRRRLFCLAELATLLYYREKGVWPKTLDETVAAGYLDEVPTLRWAGVSEQPRLTFGEELAEPISFTVEGRLPEKTESEKIEKVCRYARPLAIEKQILPDASSSAQKQQGTRPLETYESVWERNYNDRGDKDNWIWDDETVGSNRDNTALAETPSILLEPCRRKAMESPSDKRAPFTSTGAHYSIVPKPTEPVNRTKTQFWLDEIYRSMASEASPK